jgi:uncharacterized protein with FMN-binding domain
VRTRALAVAVAGSAAVLAASWSMGQAQASMQTAPIPLPPPVGATDAAAASGMRPVVATSPHRTPVAERQYTGATAHTRFGPVQVRVAMRAGRLVRVWALQLTDRYGRSVGASTRAAPVLERRSIDQNTADVVGVTGATYTSEGYRRSLQSALDQAER